MSEHAPSTNHEKAHAEKGAEVTLKHEKPAHYSNAEKEHKVEQAQKAVVAAEASDSEHGPKLPTIVDDRPQLIDQTIKALRMRQTINKVQTKLKPAERSFSKLVHQPLVQKTSESASRTVARPSGILGGGVMALIGSIGYQWLTRHYGLPYNFSFFFLFFVGGFVLGVAIEYAVHRLRKTTQ